MAKHTCFVISPIGSEGSDIYEEYKDLFELIIVPALEIFDFQVRRGDHFVSEERIDDSVIKNIQTADICICDISTPNPNVYYELGRRDETGKPVLLLKKKGTPQAPVDIANRRFFEYEWEGRYAIREAQNHIRSFVQPLLEQGFDAPGKSATLGDIADSINRLERKIDRMQANAASAPKLNPGNIDPQTDPVDMFRYALIQKDMALAEKAMALLQNRMQPLRFYDQVVTQVAAMGSDTAGNILIDNALEFVDSDIPFKKKCEYLACMISYANRRDRELELLPLIDQVVELLEKSPQEKQPADVAQIYNQYNRLFFGIFNETKDQQWLDKAVANLEKAIGICPGTSLYYNLSLCYKAYGEMTTDVSFFHKALEAIEKSLSMDTKPSKDHLEVACEIYSKLSSPKLADALEQLEKLDMIRATLLRRRLQ